MAYTLRTSQVFEYEQTTPSDTWVINHSMGMYPVVDAFVQYLGELHKIIPDSVEYTSANVCTVRFSSELTGKATLA